MNRSMMELTDVLNQEFDDLVKYCLISGEFDSQFYQKYDVKRGLRGFRRERCSDWADGDQ